MKSNKQNQDVAKSNFTKKNNNHLKIIFLMIGILCLILIPIWLFLAVPELEKVSADYEFSSQLVHTENNRFEINGDWTGTNELKAIWDEKLTGNALETNFEVKDEKGGLVYGIKHDFVIDRKTEHNLAGEEDKEGKAYPLFPLHTQKQDHDYWPGGFGQSSLFKFAGIESIYGMEVYHFLAETQISDDTAGYEFLELVPEKYKVQSIYSIEIRVEPVSGKIIDYSDKGTSYYADSSGNKVQDISEWGNRFNYETIKSQAEIAKSEKLKIQIYEIYIPLLLGLMGLVLLGLALVRKKRI